MKIKHETDNRITHLFDTPRPCTGPECIRTTRGGIGGEPLCRHCYKRVMTVDRGLRKSR